MISYFIFERFACTPREKTSQFAVSVTICGNSLLEMGSDTIIFQRKSARAHFLNFFVRFTFYLSLTKKNPKKQWLWFGSVVILAIVIKIKSYSAKDAGDYFVNNQTPELGTRQFLASRLRDRGKSFRDKKKNNVKGSVSRDFRPPVF